MKRQTPGNNNKLKNTGRDIVLSLPFPRGVGGHWYEREQTTLSGMKGSAAFQIFTTIMASGGEDWQMHVPQGHSDITSRTDLDLGACLDVEALEESSQGLYIDTESQENAWVENIIDMTSSGEMTSSDEHVGMVPASSMSTIFSFVPSTDTLHYGNAEVLVDSDNATFGTFQNLVSSETTVDLSQLTDANSGYLAQPTTVDLTSLEQLMTSDLESTSQTESTTSSSSNIPSSLWNMDFTADVSEQSGSNVKERMKTRLVARGATSTSQDNDTLESSRRSHTSSTSSLNQSMDEEDEDDPQNGLQRREKNRLAAQKCRNKKRDKTESLQKDVQRLEEKQERLKEEVRKLQDERETLEEIIHIHGAVCPKMRKISKS